MRQGALDNGEVQQRVFDREETAVSVSAIRAGNLLVYRATDTNLGRDVAIKVLPELVAQNPERLARFVKGLGSTGDGRVGRAATRDLDGLLLPHDAEYIGSAP